VIPAAASAAVGAAVLGAAKRKEVVCAKPQSDRVGSSSRCTRLTILLNRGVNLSTWRRRRRKRRRMRRRRRLHFDGRRGEDWEEGYDEEEPLIVG